MIKKNGSIAVIGAQFGDEGKGKIVDYLAQKADYVVRFHGGNNAGHTVVNNLGTFKMHLVPSGVFYPQVHAIIGNGVVIDPLTLLTELADLKKAQIDLDGRLTISPRAHVIMPYHRILDKLYEEHKGKKRTGTTGRGIGPVYADKVSYMGIRMEDLIDNSSFRDKLALYLPIKNKIIKALGGKLLSLSAIFSEYSQYGKKLKRFVKEPTVLLEEAQKKGKKILYEGAHGFFLDNDWGTYPYVTASSVLPSAIHLGAGGNPLLLERVIGIVKAYTTRVGAGPMPTEQVNGIGDKLRTIGNEFGATTGRPRRCGWFDAELVRHSARIGLYSELALTKIDVLSSFPTINLGTGYSLRGKKAAIGELSTLELAKVKASYEEVPGWQTSLSGISLFSKLPRECQSYIKHIEELCGVPVSIISTGPKRNALLTKKPGKSDR